MIDYIKDNYLWLGAVIVPIFVAIVTLIAAKVKKTGHQQNIGSIIGNNNTVINGNKK